MVAENSFDELPTPFVEHKIRMTYFVSESLLGEIAYLYDIATISVELTNDCSDFRWSDTTDTPIDGTYEIKAISYSITHSIFHPTNGIDTTCSANPTIDLYY